MDKQLIQTGEKINNLTLYTQYDELDYRLTPSGNKGFRDLIEPKHIQMISEIMGTDDLYDNKIFRIKTLLGYKERATRNVIAYLQECGLIAFFRAKTLSDFPDILIPAKNREIRDGCKYIIVSCAQNATPINSAVWATMMKYKDFLSAEVLIIPIRYKNVTSVHTEYKQDWWDERVVPYLDLKRRTVSENLVVLSDLYIQPTSAFPLNGLSDFGDGASCIIGHPKMHLRAYSVLEGQHRKNFYTTGAVTIKNYTESIRGAIGEAHHQLGFALVEISPNGSHHVRQVEVSQDGEMNDLIYSFSPMNSTPTKSVVENYIVGDCHIGIHDKNKMKAMQITLDLLKPKRIILHDLFDGASVNPHTTSDYVLRYIEAREYKNDLEAEIQMTLDFIYDLKQANIDSEIYVVRSNHDDFLNRYMNTNDWRKDLINAKIYSELLTLALNGCAPNGLIPYLIEQEGYATPLGRDVSFKPTKHELANHGDLGANGSRGNIKQYADNGQHIIIGHGHTIWRLNKALMVGTSTIYRPNYVKGLSNWRQADVIEFGNGSVQHLIYDEMHKITTFNLNSI